MKIITSMLIAVIIPLTYFPAPITAPGGSSGGGGAGGGGGGGRGGGAGWSNTGSGYRGGDSTGGAKVDPNNPENGEGYKGTGNLRGKPGGGGDAGAAIVVIPKPLPVKPLPKECKAEVHGCITKHIYKGGGEPPHRGDCCVKIKNSVPCLCAFITSKDPKVRQAADGVLHGCHYRKPICIKMPMPLTCRQEVRHCVDTHLYGNGGQPPHGGACCLKFKNAKECVTRFLTSPDPKLSEAANAVLRGCHFRRPPNT